MTEKRALIVDDDYANRSIWSLFLADRGYDVLSAPDVTTGLAYVSQDVTLYLIDYHLPDGNGIDMLPHIRQQAPESMVVTVSMDDDVDVIQRAMESGGNIFMVKPTSPLVMHQLLDEIESGQLTVTVRQLINRNGRRTYAD